MNYDIEKIRVMLLSPAGEELRSYLAAKLFELRLIDNVKRVEHPYAQAVELTAQKKAYEHLAKILAELKLFTGENRSARDGRDSFAM